MALHSRNTTTANTRPRRGIGHGSRRGTQADGVPPACWPPAR